MIGWVAIRGGSVWPAVIAHALFNGFGGTAALFMRGEPNPLLGPLPVGVIAALPMTALAAWILLSPRALRSPEETGKPE
jgi:membrane protease YdiL (CAAX protease family)